MKNYTKAGLIIILLGITTYLGASIKKSMLRKEQIAKTISQMPAFSLSTIEGNVISESDLKGKKNIIIYFDVSCDFCQAEAIQVKENLNKLQNINILMVSKNTKPEIIKFRKDYGLNKENIQFLLDDKQTFLKSFGIAGQPSILLYDENEGLIKRIDGSIKMDTILKTLNK